MSIATFGMARGEACPGFHCTRSGLHMLCKQTRIIIDEPLANEGIPPAMALVPGAYHGAAVQCGFAHALRRF